MMCFGRDTSRVRYYSERDGRSTGRVLELHEGLPVC